jgi:hypothetical protein
VTYRLFVSHSSSAAGGRERLDGLLEALGDAGQGRLQVLCDRDQIVSGDDWRRRIAIMLHACHGGVILLSKEALESHWVLAEATFLSLRHEYDPSFACVPVSFLDEAELAQGLSMLEVLSDPETGPMAPWQVADLPRAQFAKGREPPEIAQNIVDALQVQGRLPATESSADVLGGQLAPHLTMGSEAILRELASELEDATAYFAPDPRVLAACAIVAKVLRTGRLVEARAMLDRLGTAFPDEERERIVGELVPLRFRLDASALFRRRRPSGGLAHTGVSCDIPEFTIPNYLRRAYLTGALPILLRLPNDHGSFEQLRSALREAWREAEHGDSYLGPPSDEEVDEELADPERPVYAAVPGPVDEMVMMQLDAAYPEVGFIVHQAHSESAPPFPSRVLSVLPHLQGDEERHIILDYERAKRIRRMQDAWQR